MKRLALVLLTFLLLAGRAQAQQFSEMRLWSMVSFDQYAIPGSAATFTLIESLSSVYIELHQLRLNVASSQVADAALASYKLRQAFARVSAQFMGNGDIGPWTPLVSVTSTTGDDAQPFGRQLLGVQDTRTAWFPYYFRLAPGGRLQIQLFGYGRVYGYARFVYRPVRGETR